MIKDNGKDRRQGGEAPTGSSNPFRGIRKRLLAGMVIAPLVPFLFVLLVGQAAFVNSVKSSTVGTMQRIVEDHGRMIDSYLQERRADLEMLLDTAGGRGLGNQSDLENRLRHLRRSCPAFVDLGYIAPDGVQQAYAGPYDLLGKDYSQAPWYTATLEKGYHVSDVFLGYRNEPHFVIAVSRQEAAGRIVLRATMDPHRFSGLVEGIRLGGTGEAWVLDAEGRYQTEPRSQAPLLSQSGLPQLGSLPKRAVHVYEAEDSDGKEYMYCTSWINDGKWLLVVRQEKDDAFAGLQEAASWIAAILLFGGLLIVALAFILTTHIEHSLSRVSLEKETLRNHLYRAARLAELGEMTTGIAHEINNPLQVMKSDLSYMEMVMNDMAEKNDLKEGDESKELRTSLEQLRIQISRCAKITQAILKFGRQGGTVVQDMDVRSFLPEIVALVEEKAAVNGIRLEMEPPDHPIFVRADPGQVQQILLNLLNNALHAVEERHPEGGGVITVSCSLGEDGMVGIDVRDNGSGISPENMECIFTPFFTTKPVGKGTGLGLSVCHGIVDRMGGQLDVRSTKGVGTTFTVRLPRPTK
jgi:two-component system NtrC family sensor kinase